MESTENKCDMCEACADACTMHESAEGKMSCDNCEACSGGCTMHEGE